jgi:hypothetical protein
MYEVGNVILLVFMLFFFIGTPIAAYCICCNSERNKYQKLLNNNSAYENTIIP